MDVSRFDEEFRELLRKLNERPDDLTLISKACYGFNIRAFHDLCIEHARKGLARDPFQIDLYYELIIASSLDTAHILRDLQKELEKLLDRRPNSVGLRNNLALVHYFLERDDEAERLLSQVLDEFGENEITYHTFEVLAQLEYTRQNLERCIQYCDQAIDKPGPSARMVRLKGLCYQDLGDYAKARRCFLLALEHEHSFVWACHSLGELCLEQKEFDQAFRYFGKATYINPTDPGNLFLLAEAFIDMEAYDLAAGELNKLLLLKPEKRIEAEVYNALGFLHIKKNEPDKARDHLSHALDLEPELAVAYYNMGRLAVLEQLFSIAETNFKNALKMDPLHLESWIDLGFLHLEQKNVAGARRCFEEVLRLDPDEAQAFLGLSKLEQLNHQSQGQLKQALTAYELDPEHPEICNNLGIAHECNEEFDDAEKAYLRALSLDANHAPAANNLGYLYEKKMKLFPEQKAEFREKAIHAWTQRLQICSATNKSTLGAKSHLLKLGLSRKEIERIELTPDPAAR